MATAKWACVAMLWMSLLGCSFQQTTVQPSEVSFSEDVYTAIISEENGETPVQVLQVSASGDSIWYSLQDTASHYFSINPRTGHIELIKPLDRDEKAVYHVVAMATENDGYGPNSAFADVIIGLSDINDRAPEFMHQPYIFTVRESSSPLTVVGTMTATDLDDPNESGHVTVSYSITQNAAYEGVNIFDIDPDTAQIFVSNANFAFDKDATASYEIVIQAEDGGGLKGTSTATIRVTEPPRFAQNLYFAVLEKDIDIGDSVIVVSALDDAMGTLLAFDITNGNQDSAFGIVAGPDDNTASVILQTDLRSVMATNSTFNLTLTVSNDDGEGYAALFMKVMDTNLHAPVFTQSSYDVTLLENTTRGHTVITVSATDDDDGNSGNGQIKYNIKDDPALTGLFGIDVMTGEITVEAVGRQLDRETANQHVLVILANDKGRPMMKTGTATLTVTVEEVNDNPPMFVEDYRPVVMENGPAEQHVLTITARDADLPENGPPFIFMTNSSHFYLNGSTDTTVELWTTVTFDREHQEFYEVPIVISDIKGLSATSTLTVQIGDENDNAHLAGHSNVKVLQYRGRGSQVIGYVYSIDADVETESKTYSLETASSHFQVNSATGAISIVDKTMEGSYPLSVTVSDGTHTDQVSTLNVTVKYIFEDGVVQSTSLRLAGTTAAEFIGQSPGSESGLKKFVASLAHVLGVDVGLINVLSVDDVPAAEVVIMAATDMADVRYSVDGYHATQLDAAVGKDKTTIEQAIGLTIDKVKVNPCDDSSVCGDNSCSVVYNLDTDDNTLADTGPNSLSLSVKTSMTAQCGCMAHDCPRRSCSPNPCYNGGTCEVTTVGYKCTCPMGYVGSRCQDTKRSFSGNGYAWYDPLVTCSDSHISVEFLTPSADGLLLYNGPIAQNPDRSDFIAIGLKDGLVKLSINLGGDTLILDISDSPRLDDDTWHKVDIYKQGFEVYLVIDECMTSSVEEYPTYSNENTSSCLTHGRVLPSPDRILNLNTALQLGGTDPTYSYPTGVGIDLTRGFNGCIRHLKQDGDLLHLGNPAKTENSEATCSSLYSRCLDANSQPVCRHGECVADKTSHYCFCDAGYHGADCSLETPEYRFGTDGYVTYSLGEGVVSILNAKMTMYKISFRTANPSGTILSTTAVATREGQEYIRIRLMDGLITVEYDIGGGDMTSQVAGIQVNDSMWHSVTLMRSRMHFTVKVDKGVGCQQVESSGGMYREYLEDSKSLIVGAMPDKSDGFLGCMTDLRIGKNYIDLSGETDGTVATPSDGVVEGCTTMGCDQSNCTDNEVCVDTLEGHECVCKEGYQDHGDGDCVEVDQCADDQCLNDGACVPHPGSFACSCTDDYQGDVCQYERVCRWSEPCLNGGSCEDIVPDEFKCTCTHGWMGDTCSMVNACEKNPNTCKNGATCRPDGDGAYTCDCPYGYEGTNCQTKNPCEPNLCRNGGTCDRDGESFTCSCLPGYNGPRCDTYDYCYTEPCKNGGKCKVKQGGFECNCASGWKGTICTEGDPCGPKPCKNGGTCIPTADNDGFMCSCDSKWGGVTCETSVGVAEDTRTTGLIAAGVVLGVAALLLLILLCHCYYRNQNQGKTTKASDYTEMDTSVPQPEYTRRHTTNSDTPGPNSSGNVYNTVAETHCDEESGIENSTFKPDEIEDAKL